MLSSNTPFSRLLRAAPGVPRAFLRIVLLFSAAGILFLITRQLTNSSNARCRNFEPSKGPGGLLQLDLAGCGLDKLPELALEILRSENVEILYLTDNRFTRIPAELASLEHLSRLSLKENKLKGPLDCSALPPNIVHLILTENLITKIGKECAGKLRKLRKFMLARNRISEWDSMELPELELVRLAENRMDEPPDALLDPRNAPELKWLALGSNPCCEAGRPKMQGSRLPKMSLEQACGSKSPDRAALLGKGTSGSAYRCGEVVVKLFNGRSSDGDSAYERAVASLVPRDNRYLLAPVGRLDDARFGGLVFPFFDGRPGAAPPDLGAVSRDIYPSAATRIPGTKLLNLTLSLASAVRALHSARIAHGDIYAHNVLFSSSADRAVLIDFGASTITSDLDAAVRKRMERMDCEAFMVMAGEFAEHRLDPTDKVGDEIRAVDPCADRDQEIGG